MTKIAHICNKEVEIAEIHNDIKWIRKQLEGNGTEGYFRKIENNTLFRIQAQARTQLLVGAATLAFGGNILLIIGSLLGWF